MRPASDQVTSGSGPGLQISATARSAIPDPTVMWRQSTSGNSFAITRRNPPNAAPSGPSLLTNTSRRGFGAASAYRASTASHVATL